MKKRIGKRIFAAITALLVCLCLFLTVCAQESETAETAELTEIADEQTEAAVLSDELPEGIENAEKAELVEIINGLSGEGVDKMQALLLAGINSVERGQSTTWDRIAEFCEIHIEAISLCVCALAVLLYTVVRTRSNRKLRKDIGVATNNAVETVEIAKQMNADSVVALEGAARSVEGFKETLDKAILEMSELIEDNKIKAEENEALRLALKHNSAADMLVADTVNELLQLANIPQNKKDAIQEKVTHAKSLIDSEVSDGEGKDEETA